MIKRIFIQTFFVLLFCLVSLEIFSQKTTVLPKKDNNVERSTLSNDDRRLFDFYFYSAANAKSIENYAEVYDFLNYCLKKDSTNANVLFELGNFYKSMRNNDRANFLYGKAVEFAPTNYYYNMSLAATYIEKKEFKKAAEIYQKLVEENPSKVELYMYLSEVYRVDGNFEKSIEALNNLERTMGMSQNITMQKFKLYAALNDNKKAYTEVLKYIEKNPEDVDYYALLANLYLQDNKMKEAYDILKRGKSIDPENGYLISTLATYHQLSNDVDAAEDELKVALYSNKIDADSKIEILSQYIGSLQQNSKDTHQANPILDSLMIAYPRESKFNLLYGNLMLLQGNKKDATFQYRIYADANPTDPTGWEQLLQVTENDSVSTIIDICESAINYVPDQPLFYLYLSFGQYQQKEYKQALKSVNEGISKIDPQNFNLLSDFYSQSGSLYYELGNVDSAFIEYDKALKYNPKNLGVLNNYSYYLSLLRLDLDKAEKMSSITVKAEPTNPTFLDTYGWILFEQGAYATAKIYLENAVKYSMENKDVSSEVLEHYGDVLFMIGEKDKSLEYWNKAKDKGKGSEMLDKKIETKSYIQNDITK